MEGCLPVVSGVSTFHEEIAGRVERHLKERRVFIDSLASSAGDDVVEVGDSRAWLLRYAEPPRGLVYVAGEERNRRRSPLMELDLGPGRRAPREGRRAGVTCPRSVAEWRQAAAAYPPALREGVVWLQPCDDGWHPARASEEERAPYVIEVPALVITGEFDPTSPPVVGEEQLRWLPNGHHIVIPGMSHMPGPPRSHAGAY